MEIRCIKGVHRLKLVSSENNSVFKGLLSKTARMLGLRFPKCTSTVNN